MKTDEQVYRYRLSIPEEALRKLISDRRPYWLTYYIIEGDPWRDERELILLALANEEAVDGFVHKLIDAWDFAVKVWEAQELLATTNTK